MPAQTIPLEDSFKRQIDYLRISITDRCNLKCIYCMPDKKAPEYFALSEVLSRNEITRFVSIAHKYGVKKVRLTGGEPLMRKDVASLISDIKGVGIRDLSMTTNGLLLSGRAAELKKAGLDRVNISLDTLNPGKYREITCGGDINRILEAVDEAENAGLYPVKINMVPMRGINDDEIAEFASLTFDKDCHIRFIELMPVGSKGRARPEMWSEKTYIGKKELMEKISGLGRLIRLPFRGRGPSRNYRIEGAKGVIGFISPISDCFCEHCNRLRLTANGMIRPCLLSDIELDIRTSLRSKASNEALEEIFLKAVSVKPERHHLEKGASPSLELTSMSKIGG